MYNYVMLIGRTVKETEIVSVGDKKVAELTIAVTRPFKNAEGNYDTDFLTVQCWEYLADVVSSNLKKGDMVSLKGRLVQAQGGTCKIIAEKVITLNSKEAE